MSETQTTPATLEEKRRRSQAERELKEREEDVRAIRQGLFEVALDAVTGDESAAKEADEFMADLEFAERRVKVARIALESIERGEE